MSETQQGTTPTLPEVLRAYVKRGLDGVNVAMPAILISYNPSNNTAQLQPAIQIEGDDGLPLKLPVLGGVPVVWPSSNLYQITFPLFAEDPFTVLFCSEGIEDWLLSGSTEVLPSSKRKHSLSDAVCFPGGRPFTNPLVHISPTAMGVGGQTTHVVIDESAGKVKLGNVAAVDPVAMSTANEQNWSDLKTWSIAVETAINTVAAAAGAPPQFVPPGTSVAPNQSLFFPTFAHQPTAATKVDGV